MREHSISKVIVIMREVNELAAKPVVLLLAVWLVTKL